MNSSVISLCSDQDFRAPRANERLDTSLYAWFKFCEVEIPKSLSKEEVQFNTEGSIKGRGSIQYRRVYQRKRFNSIPTGLSKEEVHVNFLRYKVYCVGGRCIKYKEADLLGNSVIPNSSTSTPLSLFLLLTLGKLGDLRI